MAKLTLAVVTPEKTEIETEADSLVLPMYDGELGILPGRSAMIGRLGYGTLRVRNGDQVERYFVDGGFAQIERNVVSILTARSMPIADVDVAAAEQALAAAGKMPGDTSEQRSLREAATLRARGQVRAGKTS